MSAAETLRDPVLGFELDVPVGATVLDRSELGVVLELAGPDGEGGLMLYRLSNINAVIDPASHRREYEKLGEAGKFAWSNPGEFGKALINYEDLAAGRYDEWLGNLAPDALATGGAAPAVSRSLKGADAAGDLARNADRLSEGARDGSRAGRARRAAPD